MLQASAARTSSERSSRAQLGGQCCYQCAGLLDKALHSMPCLRTYNCGNHTPLTHTAPCTAPHCPMSALNAPNSGSLHVLPLCRQCSSPEHAPPSLQVNPWPPHCHLLPVPTVTLYVLILYAFSAHMWHTLYVICLHVYCQAPLHQSEDSQGRKGTLLTAVSPDPQ